MSIVERVFVFKELRPLRPTVIHMGDIVMIGDKFYRVINRPDEFHELLSEGLWHGWRFKAVEIRDGNTLEALRKRKMNFLCLNPELVRER